MHLGLHKARVFLFISGAAVMGLAAIMLIVTACMFTMPKEPPPPWDTVGYLSFWGFIPAALTGGLLLIAGLFVRWLEQIRTKKRAD